MTVDDHLAAAGVGTEVPDRLPRHRTSGRGRRAPPGLGSGRAGRRAGRRAQDSACPPPSSFEARRASVFGVADVAGDGEVAGIAAGGDDPVLGVDRHGIGLVDVPAFEVRPHPAVTRERAIEAAIRRVASEREVAGRMAPAVRNASGDNPPPGVDRDRVGDRPRLPKARSHGAAA